MPIAIRQSGKNAVVYQVQPTQVVLPLPTAAGSYLLVIVEAQKSGFPYDFADLDSNTPAPTVSDDLSSVYTLVNHVLNLSQEGPGNSPVLTQPDDAGFFLSLYAFLAPATIGAQTISVSDFYSDSKRAVFDGGLQFQVYEITGLSTALDQHDTVEDISATLGASLITPGGADQLVVEVLALMNSSAFSAAIEVTSPPQVGPTVYDEGAFLGGASYWAVQMTFQVSAVASAGFLNPLEYKGAVMAISLT